MKQIWVWVSRTLNQYALHWPASKSVSWEPLIFCRLSTVISRTNKSWLKTLNQFISQEAWLYTSICGVIVVPLYCKQWVIDGVSDKIAKPSLSRVVLLLELGWAVSCHIMSKRTVPWAQVDQQHHHHQELVRNRNSRALPTMNSNFWEWGPALSVLTSPALRS